MKAFIFLTISIILFSFCKHICAQLPDTLTLLDEIDVIGYAYDIKVSESGTVYLADGSAGVHVYSFDGTQFSNTGNINESDFLDILEIEVTGDTLIYILDGDRGVKIFKFDGTLYNQIEKLDTTRLTRSIAFGNDGTLFLANGTDGLRAYKYEGGKYANTGHIFEGASAYDVAVINDSTVLLACNTEGLYVYAYDGTSFTQKAHVDDGGSARSIAISANRTIFLANGDDGLRAYTYDNAQLTNTAHINNGGYSKDLDIASDGTIFMATDEGLRAYTYSNNAFINTAVADIKGLSVAVGLKNTVFVTEWGKGIYAYSYSGFITEVQNIRVLNNDLVSLSQNYPNPFSNTTKIEYAIKSESFVTIKIYSMQGQEIVSLVNSHQTTGRYSMQFDGYNLPNGIYYYKIISINAINNPIAKTRKMLLLK